MNTVWFQKKQQIVALFALVIILVSFADSWQIFDYPPKSVHQWRQSDCAAYVKTYYRMGSDLLHPATYNLAGKEGRVVSEFPVIYYVAAKLQHWVGEHYWVVRGLTFACYLIGLCSLMACINRWVSNRVLGLLPVVLLASSPYYFYYAINFLPNIPAISFSFTGLYFFLLYDEKKQLWAQISGTFFFILAVALKPTDGGIIWLAYAATRLCLFLFTPKTDERKQNLIPLFVSSLLIGASILGWAQYVNWYNDQNGNHQNLIGIYPIWDMDKGLVLYTAKRIITEWSNVFQQKIVLGSLLVMLLIYLIKWKQLHPFLRLFTLFIMLGTAAYAILWFKAFTDHDYYQLPFVLPAVFLSITIVAYFSDKMGQASRVNLITGAVAGMLVLISFYHTRNIQKERYTKPEYVYVNPSLFEVEPYLRSIGISTSDAVVCVPDKSPNVSLNAINNYGYSEEFNSDQYNIHTFQQQGASYLIISDSSYLHHPVYQPFTGKKVGEYKGIFIFDIRNESQ